MTRAITVGIATCRRPSVEDTIRSIEAQENIRAARIIISDNDETPSARPLIERLATELRTPITYVHSPANDIVIARNGVLEAAGSGLLALIDDDETAPGDWLAKLSAAMAPGIHAVFGPVEAVYPPQAPDWMKALSPHSQHPAMAGDDVLVGYTSNCLIDLDSAPFAGLRFDDALGQRQSEDTAFFITAKKRGARFALAGDAVLTEPVPEARLSLDWLRQRRRRHGRSWAQHLGQSGPMAALSAEAKALTCYAMSLACLPFPARHLAWKLRGDFHRGRVSGALEPPQR